MSEPVMCYAPTAVWLPKETTSLLAIAAAKAAKADLDGCGSSRYGLQLSHGRICQIHSLFQYGSGSVSSGCEARCVRCNRLKWVVLFIRSLLESMGEIADTG